MDSGTSRFVVLVTGQYPGAGNSVFFVGCFLYYLVFGSLNQAGNLMPLPDTMIFVGNSSAEKVGIGLVTGLFFAFAFLHFYYDRCLYRFGDPIVQRNVGPLLFGPKPTGG